MIREIGFARIHVFPFSPREGTPAAEMPGQLSRKEKEDRARILIADGQKTAAAYMASWEGKTADVLVEDLEDGFWRGYTPEYIPVLLNEPEIKGGQMLRVRLGTAAENGMTGQVLQVLSE